MSVTFREIPQPLFQTTPPRKEHQNSQNHKTNSGADWKAWENLIEEGMTTQQKKEMAALVQKQMKASGLNWSSC